MQERPAGSHPPLQDVVIAAGGPVKGVARHCEHRVVHPELLPALIAPVLRVECGHVVLPVEARAPPGLHAHAVYGEAATRGLQTTGGAPTLASPHVDKARSAQSILWPRVSDSIAENIGRLPKNVFAHRPACSQATQKVGTWNARQGAAMAYLHTSHPGSLSSSYPQSSAPSRRLPCMLGLLQ